MESPAVAQCRTVANNIKARAAAVLEKLQEAQLDVIFCEHIVNPFTDPPTPMPEFTSPGSLAAHAKRDRLRGEVDALKAEYDAAVAALKAAIEAEGGSAAK